MAFVVVADRASHDGHVRLGLRVVVDGQGVLYPHVEPGAEYPLQTVGHQVYADRVADRLWSHGAQFSVDEFQLGVRLECAGFYGTVVLDAAQAVMAEGDVGRSGSHDGASIVARKPSLEGAWQRAVAQHLPATTLLAVARLIPAAPETVGARFGFSLRETGCA